MSLIERSDALHAEVRAFAAGRPTRPFGELARAIAEFQAEFSPGYARLVAAAGGGALERVERIPGVPSEAFRAARVALHAPELDAARFVTSGTSGDERGIHAMRTLETYRELALEFGRQALLAQGARPYVVALAPHPTRPVSSSLGFMMALFMDAFDADGSAETDAAARFLIDPRGIDLSSLERAVRLATEQARPLLVLATSFALVELLDRLGSRTLPAPSGSALMQTGGFKGKTREIPAAELRSAAARAFAIAQAQVVSEYGMTELTSQMYEATLPGSPLEARWHGAPGHYYEPPWLRVVPVDPITLEPVADGEVGIARIVDLGNVDSALCVQTRDRVRRHAHGFELLGRAPGAVPRGCSLAIEEFLAGLREPAPRATRTTTSTPAPSHRSSDTFAVRRARLEPLLLAARAIADGQSSVGRAARQMLAKSSDLSGEGRELALTLCLGSAPTEAELRTLIESTPECPQAHVLLSAGVFTGALRAIAIALAASAIARVRPSRRDPTMTRLLHEAAPRTFTLLSELEPAAGDHFWAYGRDETLARVRAALPPGVVLHGHGAGFGVALLDASAEHELELLAYELARDIVLFDQRGCLSPRVLLVQGSERLAERAAAALAHALSRWEERVPLGRLHADELAQIAEYRDSMRFAGGIEAAGRGLISRSLGDKWMLPPVGRNLHVLATSSALELLARAEAGITTIAIRTEPALAAAVTAALPGARVTQFGRMQSPPLDGPVDLRSATRRG